MISFGPLRPDEVPALLDASRKQFGAESYQHLPRYLQWLYRSNPAGRGVGDCLVARQGDAIVGAMHRMILPLCGAAPSALLAVLHNHFIADALRSGPGVLLLRRAAKDVAAGFAPGVQAPLDEVYRRLAFVEQSGSWLMCPLAPVRAGFQLARASFGAAGAARVDVARLAERVSPSRITTTPTDAEVERLCKAMRAAPPGARAVDWTPALVRWRYFDPVGPRHLLLVAADAAAVIAIGRRRGLVTARLLELTGAADALFLREVARTMRGGGASVALAFTTDAAQAASLRAGGWRPRNPDTHSFRTDTGPLAIGPGATDVGFEAFATEFT